MLRVLLAHPEARIGTLTAHSNAGTLPRCAPAAPAHARGPGARPDGRRRARRATTSSSSRLPHGASGAIAAELEARGDGAIVVDLGADHRLVDAADWEQFYGSRARGHLAVRPARSCCTPGERTATAAAARRSPVRAGSPSRAATSPPSPSACSPASPPALIEPTRPRRRPRQRLLRRGQVAQDAPARQRGARLRAAVRGRRHAPAHPGDRAEPARPRAPRTSRSRSPRPSCRWRAASSRRRRPASPRASTRRRSAPPGSRPTRTSRSCTCCPEGQWPTHRADTRRQHGARAGRGRRARRPRRHRHGDRQPGQGHRRRRPAVPQPRARAARDARPSPDGVAP